LFVNKKFKNELTELFTIGHFGLTFENPKAEIAFFGYLLTPLTHSYPELMLIKYDKQC